MTTDVPGHRPLGGRRKSASHGLLLAGALVAMGTPPIAAQTATAPAPRGWLPRAIRPNSGLTAAQRAAATTVLARIEALLRRVPELANPEGFEVQPVYGYGPETLGPDHRLLQGGVVAYELTLMFFVPTRAAAGEGCGCLTITVNAGPPSSREFVDEQGHPITIEPARAIAEETPGILRRVPHATQVYGELWEPSRDAFHGGVPQRSIMDVLFVAAGEMPWRPVSRESYYGAVLRAFEGNEGEKLAEMRADLSRTPLEEWLAGATERREIREQTLRDAARYQPAEEVAKLRKLLEDTEREVTERLRETDADSRVRNQEALGSLTGRRDSLLADLARMTPAERRMPAYISTTGADGPRATGWNLTGDSLPPNWRVLSPNYDFWRARRSPVEVRTVSVHLGMTGTGLKPKVRAALLGVFRSLDWGAVNQLLEAPR